MDAGIGDAGRGVLRNRQCRAISRCRLLDQAFQLDRDQLELGERDRRVATIGGAMLAERVFAVRQLGEAAQARGDGQRIVAGEHASVERRDRQSVEAQLDRGAGGRRRQPADVGGWRQHGRSPGVERRVEAVAGTAGPAALLAGRRGVDQHQSSGVDGGGVPRCSDADQLGRAATVRTHSVDDGGGSFQVADDELVDHLERRDVVDRVERRLQAAEQADEPAFLALLESESRHRGVERTLTVQVEEADAVDWQVEGGVTEAVDCGDSGAQRPDRDVETSIVQRPLELRSEQVAEVLPVAHPREDPVGLADPPARQIDRRRGLVVVVASRHPAGSQYRCRRRVGKRRGVDEPVRRAVRRRLEIEHEPVRADVDPGR